MIVNIYWENCSLEISNLPRLKLEGYKMCVRSLYAEFYKEISNTYITLKSIIVERSEFNPKQEIMSFNNNSFFPRKLDCKPDSRVWYPLKIAHLEEATIKFNIDGSDVDMIKKLHLQLEFRQI